MEQSGENWAVAQFQVLVVDSNLETQFHIFQFLKRYGYRVYSAGSNQEAMSAIRQAVPDIVICEIGSEDVDGKELCRRLKSSRMTSDIYCVGIGDGAEPGADDELYAVGIDSYLEKPVQDSALLSRLQAAERILLRTRGHEMARQRMYREMDVLLIQDGGCAPGYNPVTAFLTDDFENNGHRVYCAREGFRSLVNGEDEDFVRLIYNREDYKRNESIPGVIDASFLTDLAGGHFRSERFSEFKTSENQIAATRNLVQRNVRIVVAIGGNGTFRGIRDLARRLPDTIQTAFIPVTVDSDVSGTECIGQHTGVECGAEKLRRYMADARTHGRVYVIELMGARGGFHALYSSLGARIHMAVLPNSHPDFHAVMDKLNGQDYAVIAVAEGYCAENEERIKSGMNAAEFFAHQLNGTGIQANKRIISEPFSRDLRGALPNNLDMALARRMSWAVTQSVRAGDSAIMPAVASEKLQYLPFWEIETETGVSEEMAQLANRLTPIRMEPIAPVLSPV